MSTQDNMLGLLRRELQTGDSTPDDELNPRNVVKHFALNNDQFPNIDRYAVPPELIPSKQEISRAFKMYGEVIFQHAQNASSWLSIYSNAPKLKDTKIVQLVSDGVRAGSLYNQAQSILGCPEENIKGYVQKVLTDDALYARVVYELLALRFGDTRGMAPDLSPVPVEKLLPHLPSAIKEELTPAPATKTALTPR